MNSMLRFTHLILTAALLLGSLNSCQPTDNHDSASSSEHVISQGKVPLDSSLNQFLDAWHRAAASADEDLFFGSMAPGGIYLGTDPSERWTRESFQEWAMPHFQKESAWDFTPHHREWYCSEDGTLCWFEELLDTWMGTCRGSGVVQLIDGQWKIKHYNLALTIYNEAIREVIDVNIPSDSIK